ncbi:MAG: response regulator [Planctomycetota bacterium]
MINITDYIDELRYNIRVRDRIKAECIILQFENVDIQVRKRVVFELSRADDDFAIPLLEKIISSHPKVIEAIPALKQVFINKISDNTHYLEELLARDRETLHPNVHRLMLDAVFAVRHPQALDIYNRGLLTDHAPVRNIASAKLALVGEPAVSVVAENLNSDNYNHVVYSLDVLGEIGHESAIRHIRKLLHNMPDNANVRFAAYEALGKLPIRQGAHVLVAGLEDPDDSVAMSATKAVDRNLDDFMLEGVTNLVRSAGSSALRVAQLIVNSESDRVFINLIGEKAFREQVIPYLAENVPDDVKKRYTHLLRKHGFDGYAEEVLMQSEPEKSTAKKKVWAVDDSKMILRLYNKALFNLGYEVELFESPLDAWERLQEEAPDVLLTDLNMPEMTGVQLVKKVRTIHPKNKLPIIMITTQDENDDHREAFAVGVDRIFQKPFNEQGLGLVIAAMITPSLSRGL